MIWLIAGVIVCAIIIIGIFRDNYNNLLEKFFFSFMALLFSLAISILVLVGVSTIVSCCADIDYDIVSDTKIIALKDNQNVSGRFYIMGGYVDEDLYYYYAVETEFGYKTEKIKASNVYIKYTDGETHIERYGGEFANSGVNFWAMPMCDDRYIIYVPDGTVTNEFVVDLE